MNAENRESPRQTSAGRIRMSAMDARAEPASTPMRFYLHGAIEVDQLLRLTLGAYDDKLVLACYPASATAKRALPT